MFSVCLLLSINTCFCSLSTILFSSTAVAKLTGRYAFTSKKYESAVFDAIPLRAPIHGHAHTCSHARQVNISRERTRCRGWLAGCCCCFVYRLWAHSCECVECCARCCYYDSRNTSKTHCTHESSYVQHVFFTYSSLFLYTRSVTYVVDSCALPSLTVRTFWQSVCVVDVIIIAIIYFILKKTNYIRPSLPLLYTQRAHTHIWYSVCIWIIKRLQYTGSGKYNIFVNNNNKNNNKKGFLKQKNRDRNQNQTHEKLLNRQ